MQALALVGKVRLARGERVGVVGQRGGGGGENLVTREDPGE